MFQFMPLGGLHSCHSFWAKTVETMKNNIDEEKIRHVDNNNPLHSTFKHTST